MAAIFHSDRKYIYFLLGLILIWIILFEFILPPNHVLPGPSITFISIFSLFKEYQFLNNMLSSISAIYLSSITAGLFIWIFKRYLFNSKNLVGFLKYPMKLISGILPGVFIGLFFIFWFPDSEYYKYVFIFFISSVYLLIKAENELKKVGSEFNDAIASLGIGKNLIFDKIYWKVIEPVLIESLVELHIFLWSILIVFEIIKGGSGIGTVLRNTLLNKDLAGLFASFLLISVIILVGDIIIKYFKNKFFSWSIV
jgi:putative hydroxymethylpyrimidine transport system permease protein